MRNHFVFQENVNTIVMLTNLVENGKKKCDKYWPDFDDTLKWGDEESQNGILSVTLDDEKEHATFVKRTMTLERKSSYYGRDDSGNASFK